MINREYIKTQIDTLPDSVVEKVQEYIAFQKFTLGLLGSDTEYLDAIPGMKESILEGKATPLSECLDSIGWDIN